jgi:hypothetical protein
VIAAGDTNAQMSGLAVPYAVIAQVTRALPGCVPGNVGHADFQ